MGGNLCSELGGEVFVSADVRVVGCKKCMNVCTVCACERGESLFPQVLTVVFVRVGDRGWGGGGRG